MKYLSIAGKRTNYTPTGKTLTVKYFTTLREAREALLAMSKQYISYEDAYIRLYDENGQAVQDIEKE